MGWSGEEGRGDEGFEGQTGGFRDTPQARESQRTSGVPRFRFS